MPVYANLKIKKSLSNDFLFLLKGKTCFYIRNTDKKILSEVEKSLGLGLEFYKKSGWV